jgi:integrase
MHPSNMSRSWLKAARAAAAPAWSPNWSWHGLRHAFCTDLLVKGAQDTDVALAAGHRDSGVTRAMYVGATAGTSGRLNALLSAGEVA